MKRITKLGYSPTNQKCQHEVINRVSRISRDIHGKDYGCRTPPRYRLDGKIYCGTHAAKMALRILQTEER